MRVKVAMTAGFCMGVRRAVNLALDAARDEPGPIHTLGPLIHNPQVVEMLGERGVRSAEEAPGSGRVVIRSHGVSPAVREELKSRGLEVFDATCPRVAKVHGLVRSHHKKGFLVVVLGDPGHAEVDGIQGCAEGRAIVVQSPEEIADLPAAEKVCLVAQTTQERGRFAAAAAALRRRYPRLSAESLVVADTICDSTRNRQDEVRRLAREVEAVVVVGGKKSANTKRLAEVALTAGVPAFVVETEAELPREELSRFRTVGLTAGASTPNWMIRRVYAELALIGRETGPLQSFRSALRWLVLANVYVAMAAAGLTIAAGRMQGFRPGLREVLVSALYVFAVHTMSALADPRGLALSEPARARAFREYRRWWILASGLAVVLAAALGFSLGAGSGLLFILLSVASFLYPVRLIRGEERRVPIRSLAEVPGSKDIFMALGWAAVTVVLPLVDRPVRLVEVPPALVAFALVLGMAFARALLRDFRDIQADRLIGRETMPVVIGKRNSRRILYATMIAIALVLTAATRAEIIPSPLGYLLLIPLAYTAACVPLFTRQALLQGFGAESIIDLSFLLAGGLAVIG